MVSKIIQKEKDRQERYFTEIKEVSEPNKNYVVGKMDSHKQSLINLKEYMEGELLIFNPEDDWIGRSIGTTLVFKETPIKKMRKEELKNLYRNILNKVELDLIDQLKEDIKALEEMIGRYE